MCGNHLSRQAQMQNSPTGANTNRKLGKSWAHIRDFHNSHRLAEGCCPYDPAQKNIKKGLHQNE